MNRRKFVQSASLGSVIMGVSQLQACGTGGLLGASRQPDATNQSVKILGKEGKTEKLPPGQRNARRVCVIGGGIAGLSAALELAERNYDVTLKESESYLGGRLHTRPEQRAGQKFAVEHGLHMWFYQYYNFQNTLERLGVWEKNFRDFKEVYFAFKPPLKPEVLRSEGPYPLNMLGIIKNSPNLNLLNAAGTFGAITDVIFFDHDTVYKKFDGITFEDWMENKRVDQKFRDVVMRPAASVTLNDPNTVSAAEMINYQHIYFIGHPKAFHRKVTTTDHETAVIGPWSNRLRELGVKIQTNTPVQGLLMESNKVTGVISGGQNEEFDEVILALDVPGLQKIVAGARAMDGDSAAGLSALKERISLMRTAPSYSVLRVWLDKPISKNRSFTESVIECSEYRPINLISITSMLEDESAEWAQRTGGSIVEYHLYNTPEFAGMDAAAIWQRISTTALGLVPELAAQNAKPVDFSLGQFKNFTSFEVGQGASRPTASYPRELGISNLSLSGDCIATRYPSALMERALSTGREAANLVLRKDEVTEVDLVVASSRGPGIVPRF
jgi:isorenieratene synthase